MTPRLLPHATALCLLAMSATPAMAISQGKVLPSGKECRVLLGETHYHHGSSFGQPTEAAAREQAVKRWIGFTRFEYGAAWADFDLALHKAYACGNSDGRWYCRVRAQPCRN